jgi:hypothetical protein
VNYDNLNINSDNGINNNSNNGDYNNKNNKKNSKFRRNIFIGLAGCLTLALIFWGFVKFVGPQFLPNRGQAAISDPSPSPSSSNLCDFTLVDADSQNNGKVLSGKKDGVYGELPIPENSELVVPDKNLVFSGWFSQPEGGQRVGSGTDIICDSFLYGRWITKNENEKADVQVPILMYHYFTKNSKDSGINANFQLASDFDHQMKYLYNNNYYYPSWKELSAFIDGKLFLPNKSVMVTDDDNEISWYDIGVPIINKYKVFSTMFCITGSWWETREKSPSKYVMERSHTNGMHSPENGNFIGYMIGLPSGTIAKDLEESAKKLHFKEVLAYPAGEYNDEVKKGLRQAGFEMAVTTEPGFVKAGSIKLELPRQRMSYGQSLEAFKSSLGL